MALTIELHSFHSLFFDIAGILALTVYLHNRPVSWCPPGIFWGLPAGGPGRPADARASSHRCRRIRSQPLSTPPSPSHLPSACRGARCQGNRWETGREDSIAEMSGMANTNNASVSVVHDRLIEHKDFSFNNMMVLSCSLGGDKSHLKPGVFLVYRKI